MSWIGGRAGGGFLGVWDSTSSRVTSHIYTNSKFNILFTTFCERDAAGLQGVYITLVPDAVARACGSFSPIVVAFE